MALVVQGIDPQEDKLSKRKELTISALGERFLADRKSRVKPNTYRRYAQALFYQIVPALGRCRVTELKRPDIQRFYNDVIEGGYMHRTYKKQPRHQFCSGANIARKTLHTMYEFAIANDWARTNPCEKTQTLPTPKRTAYLDDKGLALLGEALSRKDGFDPRLKDIVRLLALTGCRKGEVLSLRWRDVDFDAQVFRFPDTKTGAQNRPFGKAAKSFLNALKEKRPESADGYVFTDMRRNSLENIFHRLIVPAVKVPGFCPHALRHTFATAAATLGYSDYVIAGLLGHHINTITNRYTQPPMSSASI